MEDNYPYVYFMFPAEAFVVGLVGTCVSPPTPLIHFNIVITPWCVILWTDL